MQDGFTWWHGVISLLGGAASFRDVFTWEDTWKRTLLKFLSHMATSSFAGIIAYYICQALGASIPWTLAGMGLMSWRGAKGLEVMAARFDKWTNDQGSAK